MQEWHDNGVIRRVLIIDDEPLPAAKPEDRTLDDSVVSNASNRSPFQRVKKHMKQMITGYLIVIYESELCIYPSLF